MWHNFLFCSVFVAILTHTHTEFMIVCVFVYYNYYECIRCFRRHQKGGNSLYVVWNVNQILFSFVPQVSLKFSRRLGGVFNHFAVLISFRRLYGCCYIVLVCVNVVCMCVCVNTTTNKHFYSHKSNCGDFILFLLFCFFVFVGYIEVFHFFFLQQIIFKIRVGVKKLELFIIFI